MSHTVPAEGPDSNASFSVNHIIGQAWWHKTVIPTIWKTEEELQVPAQMRDTLSQNKKFLKRAGI